MNDEEFNKRRQQFVEGLERLTRETRVVIGGCGCCSSPYAYPLSDEAMTDGSRYVIDDRGGFPEISWEKPREEDE